MRLITRDGLVCSRSLWLLTLAIVASACGSDPGAPAATPADAALLDPTSLTATAATATAGTAAATTTLASAIPTGSRPYTCLSTRRNAARIQATGTLGGSSFDSVALTLAATGGTLVTSSAPTPDPTFNGGAYTTAGYAAWALGSTSLASYHLLVWPGALPTAFTAVEVADYPGGARVVLPLTCSAPLPVILVAPLAGPPGPAARRFACRSPGAPADAALSVAGALDARDAPRDVSVASAATGAALVLATAPAYDATFEGGAWVTSSGLFAWALGAGATATYHLLLPGAPLGAAFDAVSIADYGAGGQVQISLSCTAG